MDRPKEKEKVRKIDISKFSSTGIFFCDEDGNERDI